MACDIDELLEEASCFQCLDEKAQLAVIATLLCDISQNSSGALSPLTTTVFQSPIDFPFEYTTERRAIVEVRYTLTSSGGTAGIAVSRTGVPDTVITILGPSETLPGLATFRIGPGDTIVVANGSSFIDALATLEQIIIYTE